MLKLDIFNLVYNTDIRINKSLWVDIKCSIDNTEGELSRIKNFLDHCTNFNTETNVKHV